MPDARRIAVLGAPLQVGAGGATDREARLIMMGISEPGPLSSIDLAEPNPFADACGRTGALPVDPSACLMGRAIIGLAA